MKLVIAVVQDKDGNKLRDALIAQNFRATKLASTGGFLRSGNTTFLIGVEDHRLNQVLDLIKINCRAREQLMTPVVPLDGSSEPASAYPVPVQVGGATVFVVDILRFEQY